MCKINVKTKLYYANANMNMTRLWCKIVHKTDVKQTKGNEEPYSYLYLIMCASSRKAS
jgi:hypothetical protein